MCQKMNFEDLTPPKLATGNLAGYVQYIPGDSKSANDAAVAEEGL
jgi:hypothetical protein